MEKSSVSTATHNATIELCQVNRKTRVFQRRILPVRATCGRMNQQRSLPERQYLKKRIDEINSKNLDKEAQLAVKELQKKHLSKLEKYEEHLEVMGDRNSYSKTDEDSTFM
jgi:hypothetical protein